MVFSTKLKLALLVSLVLVLAVLLVLAAMVVHITMTEWCSVVLDAYRDVRWSKLQGTVVVILLVDLNRHLTHSQPKPRHSTSSIKATHSVPSKFGAPAVLFPLLTCTRRWSQNLLVINIPSFTYPYATETKGTEDDIAANNAARNQLWALQISKFLKKRLKISHTDHRPTLCSYCQQIDLSKLNNREPAKYSLGTWQDVLKRSQEDPKCSFCMLVRAFVWNQSQSWYHDGEASIEWLDRGGFFIDTIGDNMCFLNGDTAVSPLGSARLIKPCVDPEMIRNWVGLCEAHHPETCTPKLGLLRQEVGGEESHAGLKVFRVVDVQKMCIVEAVAGVRYVALSYIWGQVTPSLHLLRNNVAQFSKEGSLAALRHRIPRTIDDAIELVASIGERYLWVDSLCLIQDDDEDMLDGIGLMDLVYQLQELVLSYRTLVFTESCVYFRCRQNCWSEDTVYDRFPTVINNVLQSGPLIDFLADSEPSPLEAFSSQLVRYTGRKLTKESDTLHAFTGILRRLAAQMRSGVLQGLLTVAFDIMVLWWTALPRNIVPARKEGFASWSWAGWTGYKDIFCGESGPSDEADRFLKSRTYIEWYVRDPRVVEPRLVWDVQSTVRYGELEENQVGYRAAGGNPYGRDQVSDELATRDLQTRPGCDDALREEYIEEELRRRRYPFLHFFAFVVSIPALKAEFGQAPWAQVHQITGSDGAAVCGGLTLDDPHFLANCAPPHELVILSEFDRYSSFFDDGVNYDRKIFWVMLIVWRGEERVVAERRGIGILFQDCLGLVLPPGKTWKEIVLA
ncbi:hypothetical protein CVT26_013293 [Gymnopilus dilepis]|uniref:Heterokaryon incompatibility domain-containing protein n=1 Tax=Gymnopilus dilepis TaxID=231916 RepID=A0A409VUM9_9AGAR|nr:hypothetical protein CVT26_013293 [Gymnopilus dilepis]